MRCPILLFAMILAARMNGAPILTEVCSDPPGGSTAVPGDASHEYVEIYNPGPDTIDLTAFHLLSGSAASTADPESSAIQVWHGDSLSDVGRGRVLNYDSLLPPGRFAVVFGRKYASAPESTWYLLPAGTFVFALHRTGFKAGGLSGTSAQVSLTAGDGEGGSTFNAFQSQEMASGDTLTWQRVHPDSSDVFAHWLTAPATPGAATLPVAFAGAGTEKTFLDFRAINRRLIPGCDSLAFINLRVAAPDRAAVTIRVYDLRGGPVRTLCEGAGAASVRYLQWDGRNSGHAQCAPGIYLILCESRTEEGASARKIAVVLGGRCGE